MRKFMNKETYTGNELDTFKTAAGLQESSAKGQPDVPVQEQPDDGNYQQGVPGRF